MGALATIRYVEFPVIALGPLQLRTFGLMVAIGVLLGSWIAARYIEQHTGVSRDDTYRLATRLVVAGLIGARLTYDITHWSEMRSPLDLIAVWKGGLQFSGGFVAAVIIGFPTFRSWSRSVRWANLDGYALGLTIGLAFGRIGCTSVGEHFGRASSFFLAVRFDGNPADVREPVLGSVPLVKGMTFHNTAIYELLYLLVLFAVLLAVARRKPKPGTLIGIFCLSYGVLRFLSDALRVNDDRVAGLTGAQWLCVLLVPVGVLILTRVRRTTSRTDLHIGVSSAPDAHEDPESEADDALGSTERGTRA